MKLKVVLVAAGLTLCTASPVFASKTILPDACGNDAVEFNVLTKSNPGSLVPPADGKAQIVFIESYDHSFMMPNIEARFGMDGAWVGATSPNSFFSVDVAPGEHHFCYSVKGKKSFVGTALVKAEAGKTYYVEFNLVITYTHSMDASPHSGVSTSSHDAEDFSVLDDEDKAKFHIKKSKLSLFTPLPLH